MLTHWIVRNIQKGYSTIVTLLFISLGHMVHIIPDTGERRYDLVEECGSIFENPESRHYSEERDQSSGKYAEVLLHWLQSWDMSTQKRVLLECLIGDKSKLDNEKFNFNFWRQENSFHTGYS